MEPGTSLYQANLINLIFLSLKFKFITFGMAASATDWPCPLCTFLNGDGDETCIMCGTRRTDDSAEVEIAFGEAEAVDWECKLCTVRNPSSFLACKVRTRLSLLFLSKIKLTLKTKTQDVQQSQVCTACFRSPC